MSYVPPGLDTNAVVAAAGDQVANNIADNVTSNLGLQSEEEVEKKLKEQEATTKRDFMIHSSVAAFAVLASLAAMAIEASLVVYVAFVIPLFTAPYAVWERKQIGESESLKTINQKLVFEVNRMEAENEKLSAEVDKVEKEASRLQDMESTLAGIAEREGRNVEQLCGLVKENGIILKKTKDQLEAEAMQAIMTTVLRSDRNEDNKIDDRELNILIFRVKEHGHMSEDIVRTRLQKVSDRSLNSMIKAVFELIHNEANLTTAK